MNTPLPPTPTGPPQASESIPWGSGPALRPYGLDSDKGPAPGSVPVSVAILTRNEETRLPGCLASVAFAAEVVVVDAQSSDQTVRLAAAAGAQVYVRPWTGLSSQRAFSLAQCAHDWVLSLEADERISLSLADEIAALLKGVPQKSVYKLRELNLYFGRWLKHGGVYPGHRASLFDRRSHSYEAGPPDTPTDIRADNAGFLKGHRLRLACPAFGPALAEMNARTVPAAKALHAQGLRSNPLNLLSRPIGRFFLNYVVQRGFLDGTQGFLYCVLNALDAFVTSVKLWELGRLDP